jgi:enamine deaminase RidA (YjgF/YER057c/UK114 family)
VADVRRLQGDPPSPYEERYGYSRVVIAGGLVMVGGTTSVGPAGTVLGETPYEQMVEILRRVLHELSRAGATSDDVVAVRAYVTDISRGDEVARAFTEILGAARPILTMIEVSALIDPRMCVEVEATAVAGVWRAADRGASPA